MVQNLFAVNLNSDGSISAGAAGCDINALDLICGAFPEYSAVGPVCAASDIEAVTELNIVCAKPEALIVITDFSYFFPGSENVVAVYIDTGDFSGVEILLLYKISAAEIYFDVDFSFFSLLLLPDRFC